MAKWRPCNRCGNLVVSTSRLCRYCGKNPHSGFTIEKLVVWVLIIMFVLSLAS